MRKTLGLVVLAVLILLPDVFAQPFLPPGVLNPGGLTDNQADAAISHVIDPQNVAHAVWISQVDYTGSSGNDFDVFYSRNGGTGWSQPVLVNSYGATDSPSAGGPPEDWPTIALGPDGTLHCVWQSMVSFKGTGSDWDIFYSRNSGTGWKTAEVVNSFAASDPVGPGGEDRRPGIAVGLDGRVVVAWESDFALTPAIGTDKDIFYAVRTGVGTWPPAQALNTNAASDSGDDEGPVAMTTTAGGDIIAVWSTDDNVRVLNPLGTDRDIVWSTLPPGGSWSVIEEVTALARTDGPAHVDESPAVVAIGSGLQEELHFVWASNNPIGGSGNDYDILHTVIGTTRVFPPFNEAWLVNSSTAVGDAVTDDDLAPALCAESGKVIHCVWHSTVNWLGLTGSDYDVYHSMNATRGSAWSLVQPLGLNAGFDSMGEDDMFAGILCAPNGVLSAVWQSTDDLLGVAGNDWDIFNALGASQGISRPELINVDGQSDQPITGTDSDWDVSIALAPDGTLHAVWSSGYPGSTSPTGTDFDIFHATLGPTGWSHRGLVNINGISDSGDDYWPVIAIDPQGTLHVVWSSDENIGGALGTDSDILYAKYSSDNAAMWTSPELVNSNGQTDSLEDWQPAIAVAPDGTVHVVWDSEWSASGTPPSTSMNISYAYRSTGGWSTAEVVNSAFALTALGINDDPDLILGKGDTLHVVWESDADYNGAGADDDILYSNRSGGSWSTPEFVNDAVNDVSDDDSPKMALTPDGTLHVVWDSDIDVQGAGTDDDIVYCSRASSGWTPVQLLSASGASDTGQDWGVDVAVDRMGDLHIAWHSNEGFLLNMAGTDYDILYTHIRLPATLPSTSPVVLANPSGWGDQSNDDDMYPKVLVDHDGFVHFAWFSNDPLGGTIGSDYDVLHSRTNFPVHALSPVRRWQLYY